MKEPSRLKSITDPSLGHSTLKKEWKLARLLFIYKLLSNTLQGEYHTTRTQRQYIYIYIPYIAKR